MTTPTPTDAATPRPWKFGDGLIFSDSNPHFQTTICKYDFGQIKPTTGKANAALIIRAVNLLAAHEAVVEDTRKLEEMLRQTVSAFAVTLMVLDERANGETDPEKRYQFAEDHREIKQARQCLKDCEALAQLAKLKEELK